MNEFSQLYLALDNSNRTLDKVAALVAYFSRTKSSDAAWAVYFLVGNRPKQAVSSKRLKIIAAEVAGLPEWLFAECYDQVGDLAETIANVLPERLTATRTEEPTTPSPTNDLSLSVWVTERVLTLCTLDEATQRQTLIDYWDQLSTLERFVFNKLITGGFRVGVSQSLVVRALSQLAGIDAKIITHRLAGDWLPSAAAYEQLIATRVDAFDPSQPYPFFLAEPLVGEPSRLGDAADWQAEWKWDGIRGQLIIRGGQTYLWSRGEELISAQFPEIMASAATLDEVVLDGEVLAKKDGRIMPFTALQKRLGRKKPGKKVLADTPVIFIAYDVLEIARIDIRHLPLSERRAKLQDIVNSQPMTENPSLIQLSDIVRAPSWATLARAREDARKNATEGLMLKRRDSSYGSGRTVGRNGYDWVKWKVDPYTIDCVLMYAQRGHGKRANLYTDYTFGIWKSNTGVALQPNMPGNARQLVTFAKAYSGLTDAEIREVDAFVRKNTLEKFGPVRTVKHAMVFELAFEAIQQSNRHKSGFAVRFPRIARIRYDKKIEDADTVATIAAMMPPQLPLQSPV